MQPDAIALSKRIASIESEIGRALFRREQTPMELTEAGRILFKEAITIDESYRRALELIGKTPTDSLGNVRIGGMYHGPIVKSILKKAVAELRTQQRPMDLTLSFRDYPAQTIADALGTQKADAFIVALDDEASLGRELETLPLFFDPFMVCLEEHHPLAERESISLRDLAKDTLIAPVGSNTTMDRNVVGRVFSRYGVASRRRPVYIESVFDFSTIELGRDYLFLSQSMTRGNFHPTGCKIIPVQEEGFGVTMSLVSLKGDQGEALTALKGALSKVAEI